MQQNLRFDNVYVSPRVKVALNSLLDHQNARKFWHLVNKLRAGEFITPGMRIERLRTRSGKVYSARLNIEMRVIFSMYSDKKNGERSLVIWDAAHHDDAYDRVERKSVPALFQPSGEFLETQTIFSESAGNLNNLQEEVSEEQQDITAGLLLFRVPFYVLSQPDRYRSFERNVDRYLRLSDEQEELLASMDSAYLVRGGAGTGKTSLALFYALNLFEQQEEDDIYFFTYHDELACVCRCYKDNLLEEENLQEHSGKFHVFSYLEFCRHFFKQSLAKSAIAWTWTDKSGSIAHIDEILKSRARWVRMFNASNLYSYFYSILKGRFVPGTEKLPANKDDFKRIFKGYGVVPANIDEILEIFDLYEERLTRFKQKDEADLIRYCYDNLKNRAVLSEEGKATWIVIDEIQDFTELEWKSILLFWENQLMANNSRASYPFICGDRNQNISRSGFRWQELDTYVETILKKAHRAQAVQKVQLHRNFRNTREIFELGSVIHSLAPQSGADLGLPPQLSGTKPKLIVGSQEDFGNFLQKLSETPDDNMPAPLVIISEDLEAWHQASAQMSRDDRLFFMPINMSKGLEFEDLIIFRIFSSLHQLEGQSDDETLARLIDLWYMAVMRARQTLLLFVTPEDLEKLKSLLGQRFAQFSELVEFHNSQPLDHLWHFYQERERYLPNYAVVFLERTKAGQLWSEYLRLQQSNLAEAEILKNKALQLWWRCRDCASLGRAYMHLREYEKAIIQLKQASLYAEVGLCFEQLSKFADAASSYLEAGQPLDAARCFELAGKFDEAAKIFEQNEHWLQAATNYYRGKNILPAATCFEKAEMFQSAADLYRLKSNWQKAAELYQKCDQFTQAAEMYLKLKDKLDAARCYMRGGQADKAATLFESLMRWGEAGQAQESAQNFRKASVAYTKAGRPADAARCQENCGELASAASSYERLKNWEKAASAYRELKNFAALGRCLENLGQFEEAAQSFVQTSMPNEAGRCFEKCEQWLAAAEQFLKADNKASAAPMLVRCGRRMDAARLYVLVDKASAAAEVVSPEACGNTELRKQFIDWLHDIHRPDLSAPAFEALGDFATACAQYKQVTKFLKAAQCAEKHGDNRQAAELYFELGNYEQAAICFCRAKDKTRTAQCYELLKKWSEARDLYRQLGDREGLKRCDSAADWL